MAAALGLAGGVSLVAHRANADDEVTCRTYSLPVSLSGGGPAAYRISGELCATTEERHDGRTVQLLIHGATYNHTYWDFGFDNDQYSYAKHIAARGFPTFAYDRIGAGASSRPPGALVTVQAAAAVAHQVVQALRDGSLTNIRFGRVIEVGHSLGSTTAWVEAGTYQDVDGVIVTGLLHHVSAASAPLLATDLYPANQDPQLANLNLDAAYLTTRPGTRAALFYNTADADPAVITYDEAHKDAVTATEAAGSPPTLDPGVTRAITVPVLIIQGARDILFCDATEDCSSGDALVREEGPFYSPSACLQAVSVKDSGHDISLHLNHSEQEEASLAWSRVFVGETDEQPSAPACD